MPKAPSPLTEITCEEEAVWTVATQRGKKSKFGNSYVLRFVDHREFEGRIADLRKPICSKAEKLCFSNQIVLFEHCTHLFED